MLQGEARRRLCIETVGREGERFGLLARELDAAERLGVVVPWVPAWTAGDLVGHLGTVHRWTTAILRAGSTAPPPPEARPAPPAAGLPDWYDQGLAGLLTALREVPADAPAWHMSPAATRTADDWARRQAHELVVHRLDLEAAAGAPHAPIDPGLAEDGVDELLTIVLPRWAHTEPLAGARAAVAVTCRDTGRRWTVRVHEGAVTVTPGLPTSTAAAVEDTDATVEGSAAALLLRLWGRPVDAALHEDVVVTGDPAAEALLRGR